MLPRPQAFLFFTATFLGTILCSNAADRYVSLSGDNANPGTAALPWRTIQKAASSAQPGDTVYIASGTYRGQVIVTVSGNAVDGPITFQAENNAIVLLDGTGFTPSSTYPALINIGNQNYVTVKGIKIRNFRTNKKNRTSTGIRIAGACSNITIEDCVIERIANTYKLKNNLNGRDAHGIAVFGTSSVPISNLTIADCTLRHLTLGSSEALVVNGNVDGFSITNNTVHNCDNIGIDAIGYEGVGPTPAVDRARNGLISGNHVYFINTRKNPSYERERSAAGIYVDGGANILIEHNRVHHCNIGIELASEHRHRSTSNITVRNNLIYQNDIGGLFMGGYDNRRGSTTNCVVTHNVLNQNDRLKDGNGEILLQYDVRSCVVKNNILIANNQKLFVGNPFGPGSGNTFDYNLYWGSFSPNKGRWEWNRKSVNGISRWRGRSGQGAHSFFANPELLGPDNRLSFNSPAIDAGDPAFTPEAGHLDLDGDAPINGGTTDIGLDEFVVGSGPFALRIRGKGSSVANGNSIPQLANGTHLGNVTISTSDDQEFEVQNVGAGTLTFDTTNLSFTGSPTFSISNTLPAALAAGQSASISATVAPQDPGPVTGQIEVRSDSSFIHKFSLRATGTVPGAAPNLKFSGRSFRIPTGNARPRLSNGTKFSRRNTRRKVTRRFYLTNTGQATIFFSPKQLRVIRGNGQFRSRSSLPSFLDPNRRTAIIVKYRANRRRTSRPLIRVDSVGPVSRGYQFRIGR